jgi:hypothetical protein
MDKYRSPDEILDYLKKLQDRTKQNYFDLEQPSNQQVVLRPDKSISPAKFKKHPFLEGAYLAHPDTIRAVRKDLFFHGGFEDLEFPVECPKCAAQYDLQFWSLCPYCCHAPEV